MGHASSNHPPSARRRGLAFAAAVLATVAAFALPTARPAQAITTEALLDTVQHAGVMYFWNEANPANGLIKDRNTPGSVSSIASTGFGLSALCIGVEHGWLDRAAVRTRVLTTLNTFWTGPQGTAVNGMIGYKGLYYHWLNMNTATRDWNSELSTIDTALLMAGILDARHYFTGADLQETQIRALADSIYLRCDWEFMRNFSNGIKMGWKPGGGGFAGYGPWVGYNEAMILYILALGSPTHPIPAFQWSTWTSTYSWQTHYGYTYLNFPPLFGHQYSHCWVDFRGLQDAFMLSKGITYFENSRRATLAQRAYCIDNPGNWVAYSDSLWGLTASDDPFGYAAHGAPPAWSENGTITPTAGISSLPFAPEVVVPLMHNLWDNWRGTLWGPYGFTDAFNPTENWVGPAVLGIDQGPIVMMIENYRNEGVWRRISQNEWIATGLTRAGFTPVTTDVGDDVSVAGAPAIQLRAVEPTPFRDRTVVRFRLASAGRVRADLIDARGRIVAHLGNEERSAGEQALPVDGSRLAAGFYHLRLVTGESSTVARLVKVR